MQCCGNYSWYRDRSSNLRESIRKEISVRVRILSIHTHNRNTDEPLSIFILVNDEFIIVPGSYALCATSYGLPISRLVASSLNGFKVFTARVQTRLCWVNAVHSIGKVFHQSIRLVRLEDIVSGWFQVVNFSLQLGYFFWDCPNWP